MSSSHTPRSDCRPNVLPQKDGQLVRNRSGLRTGAVRVLRMGAGFASTIIKRAWPFSSLFFLLYSPVHDGRISSELALQLARVACAQRRFTSGVFEGTFIAKLVEIALIHLSRTFYCVDIAS